MGQSLVKNYLHIIFSTKHRYPFIFPPHEQALHAYVGGICKKLNSPVLTVGGFTDHIHILCMLSKNISVADFLQKIKGLSSKWIKTQSPELENFYWQDGYGAFSVSPRDIDIAIAYIKNQHEHHIIKTFQGEFLDFLEKYKLEYDERYLWD